MKKLQKKLVQTKRRKNYIFSIIKETRLEEENIKKIKEIKDHIEVNASDQDEYEEMAIQEEK